MTILKGKTAVVTGSTSGIGLGCARAFAGAGANIVLNGIEAPADVEKARTAIENDFGVKAIYSPANMGEPTEIASMISLAEKTFGRVDVLVNNAGIQHVSQSASKSRDYLMALLTMLSSSSEVGDIVVVAHSMGAMLTVDALRQLRIEGKDRVIARLGRVVLAAPDINAETFRAQVQAIGPLKPPLLVLVSKDDGALRLSSFLDGGIARAGDINVDDPVVREAALTEKVQIVDISRLAKHDDLGHDQFVSVAVLYSRLHDQAARYRNTAGTFIFADDDETFLQPIDIGNQVAAQ